ncbi:MAG: hypothetical protein ACYTFA_16115 [Planctomycetota bacterium]|jgi:hypothetical protein
MFRVCRVSALAVSCLLALLCPRAAAQSGPWLLFSDDTEVSSSMCDVVNAGNDELIVIEATEDLETIDGFVVPFSFVQAVNPFSFIDAEGTEVWVVADVFIDNAPFGFLAFAEDFDGFRTLWWLGELDGVFRVVELIGDPIEPVIANRTPLDISNVPCDACELLVGSPFCGCVDDFDCADGDTCTDDICDVDGDCVHVDVCDDEDGGGAAPRITFSFCGSGASLAMTLSLAGLVGMSLVRRRR